MNFYRCDTPTVMDGPVVRYSTGLDANSPEVSASRNLICVGDFNISSARDMEALVDIIRDAWADHLFLKERAHRLHDREWPAELSRHGKIEHNFGSDRKIIREPQP